MVGRVRRCRAGWRVWEGCAGGVSSDERGVGGCVEKKCASAGGSVGGCQALSSRLSTMVAICVSSGRPLCAAALQKKNGQVAAYCTHELVAKFPIGSHLAFNHHELAEYVLTQEPQRGGTCVGVPQGKLRCGRASQTRRQRRQEGRVTQVGRLAWSWRHWSNCPW